MSPDVIRAVESAAAVWYARRPLRFRKRVPWDEVRQAALVGAWSAMRRLDVSKATARTWASRKAKYGILDWLKYEHSGGLGNSHARAVAERGADPPRFRGVRESDRAACDEHRDDRDDFAAVLGEYGGDLTDRERAAVWAVAFDGLTFAATGARLGASDVTAWKAYRAAVAKLKRAAGCG